MNFEEIKRRYGKKASWAIWNPEEKKYKDPEIIERDMTLLKPDIIMVGLNISKDLDISPDWQNFHGGKHDRKLVNAFKGTRYWGAYMTDFIKDEPTPESRLVQKHLKSPKVEKHIMEFETELSLLETKNPTIILFGADSNPFVKTFRDLFCDYKIINILHYSYWGIKDDVWVQKAKTRLGVLA